MNSFHFVGRIAAAPVLSRHGNDTVICKFTLISNEYAGKDNDERVTSIQFTAFGKRAEAIAQHCLVGDQLVIHARIENNDRQDRTTQQMVYGFNFIVDDFDFGAPGSAKREELANRNHGN